LLNVPQNLNFNQVEIVDELGRTVLMKATNQQIDISHFNTGKYWLVFKDEKGRVISTQSVVKE
jgi:hypothetical protein